MNLLSCNGLCEQLNSLFSIGEIKMCIFSQPVTSVNNTQIFARLSGKGTQFLAYEMNYESRDPNAMILPVPVKQAANDKSLVFIDLENYETLFDDLDKGFPFRSSRGIGCSSGPVCASADALQVFEVGNYIASFVPTLADFGRLDPKFTLPEEVWEKIPGYENFGFAVFQLAAGKVKPHPMAFEFQTVNDELFFPTIHIHDGEVHKSEKFDHVLYMQHAGLDSKVGDYRNSHVEDFTTGFVRSVDQASSFCSVDKSANLIDGNLLVHRKFVQGKFPNTDTVFKPSGDPVKPSMNFRWWRSFAPWLVVLAAVGWFFNRRSKLKKERELNMAESDEKDIANE